MAYFLQQLINGLTLGSIYGLIAIGYTMVYGILGMINFAHGEIYMIGSYAGILVVAGLLSAGLGGATRVGLVFALGGALLGAVLVSGSVRLPVERPGFRPHPHRPLL